MVWDKESAREAGRKGGAVGRETRAKKAADPLWDVKKALPDLFGDLLKAARGQAPFHDLPPDKRLAALFKVLEYGAGKPVSLDKTTPDTKLPEDDGREPPGSLTIE